MSRQLFSSDSSASNDTNPLLSTEFDQDVGESDWDTEDEAKGEMEGDEEEEDDEEGKPENVKGMVGKLLQVMGEISTNLIRGVVEGIPGNFGCLAKPAKSGVYSLLCKAVRLAEKLNKNLKPGKNQRILRGINAALESFLLAIYLFEGPRDWVEITFQI